MVNFITKSAGGSYSPTPEGVHLMVCAQVIDLGTQPGSKQFPTPKRKIAIRWELPEERVEIDEQTVPRIHTETYTWSLHEKATLRQMLESWRGKKFSETDFVGPPNGFALSKLLGVPMRGNIVHDQNGDKVYANLKSVMPAGIKRIEDWPRVEGDSFLFDLDAFDQTLFEKLPKFWQDKIKASPEYQTLMGAGGTVSLASVLDDEIPF